VVEFLTLSPDLVRRWINIPVSVADDTARQVTLSRLYYVYFGLTFLGIGSAFFALFCPLIVKNYASAIEYIQIESALVTKSRMGLMVSEVSLHFTSWWGEGPYEVPELVRRLGEPSDFLTLGSVAILEIFGDVPPDPPFVEADSSVSEERPSPVEEAEPVDQSAATGNEANPFDNDPFYDFRGRPEPTKIAGVLHSGMRVYQGFIEDFYKQASSDKHRNDMLTLRYMALDNTRPLLRVIIACFYGLGFALLLIPTAITFFQVTWHIVR
jgi:hypothetical protein